MALIEIPQNLPFLVKEKFKAAKAAGSLIFSDTELAVIRANNIPFQLRYCPALSKKPQSTPSNAPKKPFNPFENPSLDLLVTELPPSHNLLLNKYPVIPDHVILATKEFKEQTHMLEEEDLGVTYACLKAWKNHGKELFAFFNSGSHSGASQRHRHIQFLDVEEMSGGKEGEGWKILADNLPRSSAELESSSALPFIVFSAKLPDNCSPSFIHELYKTLHTKAVSVVRSHIAEKPEANIRLCDTEDGSSAISYNLALTCNSMALCPRRSENGTWDKSTGDKTTEHPSLNGTILAGTLMVKSEEAWNSIRENHEHLVEVLKDIGFPPSKMPPKKL